MHTFSGDVNKKCDFNCYFFGVKNGRKLILTAVFIINGGLQELQRSF